MTISVSTLLKLLQRQPLRQRNTTTAQFNVVDESPDFTTVNIQIRQPKNRSYAGPMHRGSKRYTGAYRKQLIGGRPA